MKLLQGLMVGLVMLLTLALAACDDGSSPAGDVSGSADTPPDAVADAGAEPEAATDGRDGSEAAEVERAETVPQADPSVRLRQAGWLRGDLHMHTTYSDGEDNVETLIAVAEYLADEEFLAAHPEFEGNALDFISITDHGTVATGSDPGWQSDKLILILGEELAGPGHSNVWGVEQHVAADPAGDGKTLADCFAAVLNAHSQGGLFSINHPYATGMSYPWDLRTHDAIEVWNTGWALMSETMQASEIEVWESGYGPASAQFRKGAQEQGGGASLQALKMYEASLARGIHVAMVGGSDRHIAFPIGFPTTWVKAEQPGAEDVLAGIRARHTFVARSPVAATVEMSVTAGDSTYDLGDSVPPVESGTLVKVTVRVGRASGGLLRLITGSYVASDQELEEAALAEVVLEEELDSNDALIETELTVEPGDWLYPLVLEPLVGPYVPPGGEGELAELAQAVVATGEEDYDGLLTALWDYVDFNVVLAPQKCDPEQWKPGMFECLPVDTIGVASFYVPDWINRAFNVYLENGQPSSWCVGAVGSAVRFETAGPGLDEAEALLESLHEAVEKEDGQALEAMFTAETYVGSGELLSMLNASPMTREAALEHFTKMLASLEQIQFGTLATGDGMGNPCFEIGQEILLIADFTPLSAVVEDPAGGYSFVSDHAKGEAWEEEHSEGWYAFELRRAGNDWVIASFGLGFQ